MTQLTIQIKDESKMQFFLELLRNLDFVEPVLQDGDSKEERLAQLEANLTESYRDIQLHQQGKKQLKSAKEFLDEL